MDLESGKIYSREECRRLELDGFANPTRRVTLVDGSQVVIDRVTGITFGWKLNSRRKNNDRKNIDNT